LRGSHAIARRGQPRAARPSIRLDGWRCGAAIGIVWIYIFDDRYGLIQTLIHPLGLQSPPWLLDTFWAMPAVIIVHVWKTLGYAVVIYLAGLQGIPRELYEAALVDGAGAWARFRFRGVPAVQDRGRAVATDAAARRGARLCAERRLDHRQGLGAYHRAVG
jgi:hypothetical protein